MNETKDFCNSILSICKDRNVRISDFEAKVGVSRGYFARTAKGDSEIGLDKASRIAKEIGFDLKELIDGNAAREARQNAIKDAIKNKREFAEKVSASLEKEIAELEKEYDSLCV